MSTPIDPRTGSAPAPSPIDWLLVALLCGLSAAVTVFGVFYLPLYRGSAPIPVSVVPVVLALIVLPRWSYRLTRRMFAALAPVGIWFAVSVGLYLTTNSLFRALPLAWRGWQFALLIGCGAIAAAASLSLLWGEHLAAGTSAPVVLDTQRAASDIQRGASDTKPVVSDT